jgi:hypothetical protein
MRHGLMDGANRDYFFPGLMASAGHHLEGSLSCTDSPRARDNRALAAPGMPRAVALPIRHDGPIPTSSLGQEHS